MTTPRTAAQHLASRHNLRHQPPVRLSDDAAARLEAWRQQRVELTPYNDEKRIERETAEGN